MTERLRARIERDFEPGSVEPVVERLESLGLGPADDPGVERIQAAIVILARGDWYAFEHAANEALIDWRDVLVAAGLEHEDWPARLTDFLGA